MGTGNVTTKEVSNAGNYTQDPSGDKSSLIEKNRSVDGSPVKKGSHVSRVTGTTNFGRSRSASGEKVRESFVFTINSLAHRYKMSFEKFLTACKVPIEDRNNHDDYKGVYEGYCRRIDKVATSVIENMKDVRRKEVKGEIENGTSEKIEFIKEAKRKFGEEFKISRQEASDVSRRKKEFNERVINLSEAINLSADIAKIKTDIIGILRGKLGKDGERTYSEVLLGVNDYYNHPVLNDELKKSEVAERKGLKVRGEQLKLLTEYKSFFKMQVDFMVEKGRHSISSIMRTELNNRPTLEEKIQYLDSLLPKETSAAR